MFRLLRSNLVILLVGVFYLATLVLAMVFIDKGIYQQRKRALLFEERGTFLNISAKAIADATYTFLVSGRTPEASRALSETLRQEFAHANGVYLIRVLGPSDEVLAEIEDPTRLATSNTWRNSLFFRDFTSETNAPFPISPTERAEIFISYTTPTDVPAIEELTHRFRMIALLVAAAITVAFGTALRMVVLPIGRVLAQVQESGAELLARPRSGLERAYNAVATEALAARLSQRITALVQTPSLWAQSEFDAALVAAARETFGSRAAALLVLTPTAPHATLRAVSTTPGDEVVAEELREVKLAWEALAPGASPHLLRREGERLGCVVAVAPLLDSASERVGLAVAERGDWSHLPRWQSQVITAAATEMCRGLIQMPIFRDSLFRQKSAANIRLSRSLGHDLTNIIATSKLDILSIQRWLEKHAPAAGENPGPARPGSESLLAESVGGLLNTTRFMQEIVNIYRAFSYMDEPRWESVDLNALVSHLADLFRMTLSQRVRVVLELDPHMGAVKCEPRLLQLALFNVLTNANQAIRRLGPDAVGVITVATRAAGEEAEISVRDTGPGIRGSDGRLLEGEALYQVFFLGTTTRREGDEGAEGLGLNWVWAIVKDFHGGRIEPANRPEGGAEFRLRVPVAGRAPVAAPPGNTNRDEKEAAYG